MLFHINYLDTFYFYPLYLQLFFNIPYLIDEVSYLPLLIAISISSKADEENKVTVIDKKKPMVISYHFSYFVKEIKLLANFIRE